MNEADAPKSYHPDLTDRAFRIGLFLKGINGLMETIGGIILLIVNPQQVNHFVSWLTADEIAQNPHDWLSVHIIGAAHHLTGASLLFGAVYLLSHGIVKLTLVVEVLRNHLWAYIGLVIVTVLFIIYQLYSLIFVKVTISFILLTIFDVIIVYLTQKEYRRHKHWHELKHPKTA